MEKQDVTKKDIIKQIDHRILLLESEIRYWRDERDRLNNPEDVYDAAAQARRNA